MFDLSLFPLLITGLKNAKKIIQKLWFDFNSIEKQFELIWFRKLKENIAYDL